LLDIYWNILTMHGPINVKSPNNTSKWQVGFNSEFEGLIIIRYYERRRLSYEAFFLEDPIAIPALL
jgi:hypothetical protein